MSTTVKIDSAASRVVWNKGRLVGQKRPLRPKEVWAIRVRLQIEDRKRDLALFNLPIDSKLRGCDLVSLRVDDIAAGGHVKERATIIQHKTGRPVQFENHGADAGFAAGVVERATDELRPTRLSEPGPRPASSHGAPVRAHCEWLDRGRGDGKQRIRHTLDAAHQGGADLPQNRKSQSGSATSRTRRLRGSCRASAEGREGRSCAPVKRLMAAMMVIASQEDYGCGGGRRANL